jgi:molybdate transport system permease protein
MSAPPRPVVPTERALPSDRPFLIGLSILGGSYLVLIVAMLAGDLFFTTPSHFVDALSDEQIQYAIKLSLISCSITTILSLWVAVPLGYLMARYDFRGKWLVDSILDIPIVLPPLVIGLSLLILFQTPPGKVIEDTTQNHLGAVVTYVLLPLLVVFAVLAVLRLMEIPSRAGQWGRQIVWAAALAGGALSLLLVLLTEVGPIVDREVQRRLATRISYAVPGVILAQFSVACAFAVRTMRVTFDQINPRAEQVALTLGCTRAQAFWMVVLPEARRGLLTAATLAWARALGEFGPILVFAGTTRLRTEVLSTTVYLEWSTGNLEAGVAVSLLMVLAALVVLVIVRVFGQRGTELF